MNNTYGITHGGNIAVRHVCQILGNICTVLLRNDPRGDIKIVFEKVLQELFLEVKRGTGNQTRPHLFIPVLWYDIKGFEGRFILGDPMDVIRSLFKSNGTMRRGQHTTDSLICTNLTPSKKHIKTGIFKVVLPEQLKFELFSVAQRMNSPEYMKVKAVMKSHEKKTEELSQNTFNELQSLGVYSNNTPRYDRIVV